MSSNLIKGSRAYLNQDQIRNIDSDKNAIFRPLSQITAKECRKEQEPNAQEDDFPGQEELIPEEGLSPEEFLMREKEGFLEEAKKILEDAKIQAGVIRQQAEIQAEQMKRDALLGGKELGYQEGMQKAQAEIQQIKQNLMARAKEMDVKYEQARKSLEPEMAQVLIGLVKNLTGVILGNEESVILHLVARAMGRISRNDLFIIHVGRADYRVLEKRKPLLEKIVGQGKKIMLAEEEDMQKGQCRIETDDQIIDCGLDTQMGNLFENILLLAKV